MAQICFDSTTFYTIMIVGITVMIYTIITIYQDIIHRNLNSNSTLNSDSNESRKSDKLNSLNTDILKQMRLDQMINNAHQSNISTLIDPTVPPIRRNPFMTGMLPHPSSMPTNIPTRGEYGPFHMMGYLHNTNDNDQAMPLMGRRIHSNQYEYYTFHHNNPNIKIPINLKKEINDGENVDIPTYQGNTFQATIYDIDTPRYIPY